MTKRHRQVALTILILLLLVVGLTGRALSTADRSDQPRFGATGTNHKLAPPGPVVSAERGSFTAAEARAYALLGQFDDGVIARLPPIDGETTEAVLRMRPLLDRQPLIAGEHRPTVTSRGTFTIPLPQRRASIPIVERSASGGPTTSTGPSPTGNVVAVDSEAVATHLDLGTRTGTVELKSDGHIISGRNVWAAIHAEPGRGLPVRIADRGEGGHVVALFADDTGSLRLNGGLVVPGRYYRIQGLVEITGSAPVNVHIRPLNAVPDYHEGPLQAPSANG